MDQDQLRAILRTLIADRAQAGESLADVGRVLAQEINPTRPPFSRQYVHMLANGKSRITEEIAAAIATLAAMQVSRTDDDIPDSQAGAQLVTKPICSLRARQANAVITDPAHRCRLDGCRVEIIGRRA